MSIQKKSTKGKSKKTQPKKNEEPPKTIHPESVVERAPKSPDTRKARAAEYQVRIEDARAKRSYVPKNGEGKYFHVVMETPAHNSGGRKISRPTVQKMEFKAFIQWVQNASRLGFSFAVLHDATAFYKEEPIIKALKGYAKSVDLDLYEFGNRVLIKDGDDNLINRLLVKYYNARNEYLEEQRKLSAVQDDYLED